MTECGTWGRVHRNQRGGCYAASPQQQRLSGQREGNRCRKDPDVRGEPKIAGPEDIDRIEAQMVAGTVFEGNVEQSWLRKARDEYLGLTAIK